MSAEDDGCEGCFMRCDLEEMPCPPLLAELSRAAREGGYEREEENVD